MAVETGQLRGYIEDYLRQRGLPLQKPFRCLSPEHEDRHPSMHYNRQAQNVHCFSCGVTYDLFDLVGLDYGLDSFVDKLQKAAELFGMEVFVEQGRKKKESKRENIAIRQDYDEEIAHLRKNIENCCHYLGRRGVTPESCEKYGLFEKNGRAYFPIWEKGTCTGWVARATGDQLPRYKNSPGPLGLWNGDRLREDGAGRSLFVTEGILDAICLEQLGQAAVALCGSQNTTKMLQRCDGSLRTANSWRFVLCGDPDEAGSRMNQQLREGLERLGLSCRVLPLEKSDGDLAALCQRDKQRLQWLLAETDIPPYTADSAGAVVDDFFHEAARRAVEGAASTGFHQLDRLLDGGLHSGLYILGAISSLGKTSLVLQMAEYIVEHSAEVLFFSLEQSRFELIAKGLSRISAQLCGGDYSGAFSARQLLCGQQPARPEGRRLLEDAREAYGHAAAGLYIHEGMADIGVEEIRAAVREHKLYRGAAPVVMIDYLQILRPADSRATDKQNTDRAVVELKRLSRDFDIPVLAVSSFNRENYRVQVSMEAFKESGAVEYCADVLLGMQLQGAGSKDFDVAAEKLRDPRRIELVLLKNRNGVPCARLPLQYYPKYSLFVERRTMQARKK